MNLTSNYTSQKKLKTRLKEIAKEKEAVLKEEEYEKAATLRDEERKLVKDLNTSGSTERPIVDS